MPDCYIYNFAQIAAYVCIWGIQFKVSVASGLHTLLLQVAAHTALASQRPARHTQQNHTKPHGESRHSHHQLQFTMLKQPHSIQHPFLFLPYPYPYPTLSRTQLLQHSVPDTRQHTTHNSTAIPHHGTHCSTHAHRHTHTHSANSMHTRSCAPRGEKGALCFRGPSVKSN